MKLGDTALVEIDGRTKEARLIREFRSALMAHIGERPSLLQRDMIDQAAQIKLRLALLDRSLARTGTQTRRERESYTSFSHALQNLLRDLGGPPAAAPKKPISLNDYLRRRGGSSPTPPPQPPPPPRAA